MGLGDHERGRNSRRMEEHRRRLSCPAFHPPTAHRWACSIFGLATQQHFELERTWRARSSKAQATLRPEVRDVRFSRGLNHCACLKCARVLRNLRHKCACLRIKSLSHSTRSQLTLEPRMTSRNAGTAEGFLCDAAAPRYCGPAG
jgi:hypothetical protein